MNRFVAPFLLLAALSLTGCVIQADQNTAGATESSSKAGPTQRPANETAQADPAQAPETKPAGGLQDAAETEVAAHSHSHDLKKVEPTSSFLAEREVTIDKLAPVIKAFGKLDSHGGSNFNDAFAKQTIDKVKELKKGERISGELHTDTKNGHEQVLIAIIRGESEKVLVRLQLASKEAQEAAQKALTEAK